MEEIKNGVISEEALEEIAGGLNLSKNKVVDVLKKTSIVIGSTAVVSSIVGMSFFGACHPPKEQHIEKK